MIIIHLNKEIMGMIQILLTHQGHANVLNLLE